MPSDGQWRPTGRRIPEATRGLSLLHACRRDASSFMHQSVYSFHKTILLLEVRSGLRSRGETERCQPVSHDGEDKAYPF